MVSFSRDEFWAHIEQCRQNSNDMPAINRALETMLKPWELPKLAAFHKVMWFDVGVYHDGGELWRLMFEAAAHLGSDNSWDSYGGWLIAQGRAFHEAVMVDPQVAVARVPSTRDVWEGESVIFAAQRACLQKTGGRWGLCDLFGDDLSRKSLSGVDPSVDW